METNTDMTIEEKNEREITRQKKIKNEITRLNRVFKCLDKKQSGYSPIPYPNRRFYCRYP